MHKKYNNANEEYLEKTFLIRIFDGTVGEHLCALKYGGPFLSMPWLVVLVLTFSGILNYRPFSFLLVNELEKVVFVLTVFTIVICMAQCVTEKLKRNISKGIFDKYVKNLEQDELCFIENKISWNGYTFPYEEKNVFIETLNRKQIFDIDYNTRRVSVQYWASKYFSLNTIFR